MKRIIIVIAPIIAFAVHLLSSSAAAQQPSPATLKACQLLPKAEVKRLINAGRLFDSLPVEEEPLGTYGASCNYPELTLQVLTYSTSRIESARKQGGVETVTGVGDEAYFWANPQGYAELYVKVGRLLLTLQRDVSRGQTAAGVRPGVVALANALVPKLR